MSKYEMQPVTLGDVDGHGYAFKRQTAVGTARQGVFFVDSEDDLEHLRDQDEVTFTGPCYYNTRGPRDRSFDVVVTDVVATRMGHRVDFEAIDNPDAVLT